LNDVEPMAWLTDVLERVVSGRTKNHELDQLLPWAWKAAKDADVASTGWRIAAIMRLMPRQRSELLHAATRLLKCQVRRC